MFKKLKIFASIIFLFPLFVATASSQVISLHVPIIDDSPQLHLFFHELLSTAIKEIGHTPELITTTLPHRRIKNRMDQGSISICWLLETDEANKKYIPIEVGLTEGLIAKRVLFIKKEDQYLYDGVENLDDFRNLNLIGGMGEQWFDIKIWEKNNLQYKENSGNWKSIFKKIPRGRDYNYISRGVNEIIAEAIQYPELKIEDNLLFIYDRDFRFYLSKRGINAGAKYKDIIELAIKNAKESGLIHRLVKKYWANDFELINYDQRIKIHLQTPQE